MSEQATDMDRLVAVLEEIRDALYSVAAVLDEPGEPLGEEDVAVDVCPDCCPHPDEARVSLQAMGGPPHWSCRVCGFEYRQGES